MRAILHRFLLGILIVTTAKSFGSEQSSEHADHGHSTSAPSQPKSNPKSHSSSTSSFPHINTSHSSSPFLKPEWDKGDEEILTYRVLRPYRGAQQELRVDWRTGLAWFREEDYETLRPKKGDFHPFFLSQLRLEGSAEGRPWSGHVAWKLTREKLFSKFLQSASVHSLRGPFAQMLIADGEGQVEIKTQAFGRKPIPPRREWPAPLFTPEGLFLFIRSLPLSERGWNEEIWLLDSPLEDVQSTEPLYAKISPTPRRELIRELETTHVQVERSDGKRWEYWVQLSGRQVVVKAKYPDGTAWELLEIRRGKPLGF